jgi:hypothetical protein
LPTIFSQPSVPNNRLGEIDERDLLDRGMKFLVVQQIRDTIVSNWTLDW